MKKINLQVNVWPSRFTVEIDNRVLSWLFHKLFTVKVMDRSRKEAVDVMQRVSLPPRPGRVTVLNKNPETVPKPKAGGRVVMILPPGVKRMKRTQEHAMRRMP